MKQLPLRGNAWLFAHCTLYYNYHELEISSNYQRKEANYVPSETKKGLTILVPFSFYLFIYILISYPKSGIAFHIFQLGLAH